MRIQFQDGHWWIVCNDRLTYRLAIPKDISPEDARIHARNVLLYLVERAPIYPPGTIRGGNDTEGQPESGQCIGQDFGPEVQHDPGGVAVGIHPHDSPKGPNGARLIYMFQPPLHSARYGEGSDARWEDENGNGVYVSVCQPQYTDWWVVDIRLVLLGNLNPESSFLSGSYRRSRAAWMAHDWLRERGYLP